MAINSLNSVSHGLSGLVSGMDTQSMVDSMLAGTQAKIDKQKASRTILGYKRETYRDTISSLKALQMNFFSFTGNNSMLGSSFYNTMAAASAHKAFKVSAGSGALAGKTTVNSIERLAQSLKLKSQLEKTTSKVEGELDLSKLKPEGGEIQIILDGISKTIKLPPTSTDTTLTEEDKQRLLVDHINASIKHNFGNGVTASLSNGKISFEAADSSREFQIIGNANAMATLGMKTGISNKVNTRMRLGDINFAEPLAGDSFKFKINGVDFEVDASDSLDSVMSKINNSDANVKIRYSSIEDKFSIESTVSGEGTSITRSQSGGNLLTSLFGIGSGGGITGKTQYAYTGGLEGRVPGLAADEADETAINEAISKMNENLDTFIAAKGSFVLNVDGKDVKIEIGDTPISGEGGKYTIEDVIKAVNDNTELDAKGIKLSREITDDKFTGAVKLSSNDGVKVQAGNGMGFMGISGNNQKVADKTSTLAQLGMTEPVKININGTELTFSGNRTLGYMTASIQKELRRQATEAGQTAEQVGAIRVEVLEAPPGSEGKIRLFGVDIPTDIEIIGDDKKLFGTDSFSLKSAGKDLQEVTAGQNAIVYINGGRVERNSNEFTVGGLAFELKETFNTDYDTEAIHDTGKYADIDVTRDTDKVYDGITKFMEEYNKIVEKTWSLLKAKTTFKDYPPLTDKQKEGMSEKEVELWEKKSQEGIMRSDEKMTAIMDTMRQVLNRRPEGSKYSLAEMGLTTGYDMETGIGGKLIFNDNPNDAPGTRLRKMIAEEPEALEKLFSDSKTGLLTELNSVLDGATTTGNAGVSSGKAKKYGNLSLVDVAGSPTMIDTSSKIYNEIKDIDKNLESLNRKYKAEYSRYWKQFNAMEQMIQQMNQQSSWLTQQLGG